MVQLALGFRRSRLLILLRLGALALLLDTCEKAEVLIVLALEGFQTYGDGSNGRKKGAQSLSDRK